MFDFPKRRFTTRRVKASAGQRVAANGGQNRKATTPRFFRGLQGVGRGDSNYYGARLIPWAALHLTWAGFDSPALQPHYNTIVKRSF